MMCRIKLNQDQKNTVYSELLEMYKAQRVIIIGLFAVLIAITFVFCTISVYQVESQVKDSECLFYLRKGINIEECK